MRQKRRVTEVKEKGAQLKRKKRSDPKVQEMEAEIKRQKRSDPQVKEKEAEWKRIRHQDTLYKSKETIQNKLQRQRACQDPYKVLNEKQQAENRKYGSNITELLKIFNENIAEGPVYVCTCCQQIWFKHSVHNVDEIILKTDNERTTFSTCRTQYLSKDGKEWICKTCRNSVKEGKIPKLSIANKMGFPELPHQLKLYSMEERLIARRIVFMLLRDSPVGGQTFVRGIFVNVLVDIAPTVNTLPRSLNDAETVTIKFKRKKQYKKCEFKETIRPMAVWTALDYLLKESPLYK